MTETSAEVIRRYLQDVLTTGTYIENHFKELAAGSSDAASAELFHRIGLQTKYQCKQLSARLEDLGGSSAIHNLLSQFAGLGTNSAFVNHENRGPLLQKLVTAITHEHAQAALCEATAYMSDAAGDDETADLVRSIKDEALRCAEELRQYLPSMVSNNFPNTPH